MDRDLEDLVFEFLTKYGDDIAQAYKTLAQEKAHLTPPDLAIGDLPLPKLVSAHLELLSPDLAKDFEQRVILKTVLQKKRVCSSTASNRATSEAKKRLAICEIKSAVCAPSQAQCALSSIHTSATEAKEKPDDRVKKDGIQWIGDEMDLSSSSEGITNFEIRACCYDLEIRFGTAARPSHGGLECRKCSHSNKWCFTLTAVHGGSDVKVSREDVEAVKFGASTDLGILVFVFLPTIAFAKKITEQLALNKANGDVLDPKSSVPGAAVILVNLRRRDLVDKRKFFREFCSQFGEFKDIGKLDSDEVEEFLRVSGSPELGTWNVRVKNFYCDHLGIGAFLKRSCLLVLRRDLSRFTVIPDKYAMDKSAHLETSSVEFFQLDPVSHVVNVGVGGNFGVDLCATLTRVLSAKAKEDMVMGSKKLRSASLRIHFSADTDMNDVRSWFLEMGLREEQLEAGFAAAMLPELRMRISPAPSGVSVAKAAIAQEKEKPLGWSPFGN